MANNLVTLAEVKAYQGITNTNMDAEISNLIPKVSALVKTYLGRSIVDYFSTEKVETFSYTADNLYLKEAPINEITSVEYSIDYGKTYSLLEEYVNYVKEDELSAVALIGVDRYSKSIGAIRVTYTGGYATTPEDLKLAVLDLITYYQKAEMAVKSSRAAGANNAQIEYITDNTLPSHIRRVLDLYRLDL